MGEEEGIWLKTDYTTEGVLALEMAVEQIGEVLQDPYRWKWAIMAVHNALQAFMVHAASGSSLLGAMTKDYASHWLERYEKGERPSKPERLASFMELFARCQNLKGYVDSQPLHPSAGQTRSIKSLNRWRDTFVHYKPGSLSIEVSGYPLILRDSLSVIRFLAFHSHHVFRVADEYSTRASEALAQADSLLDRIEEAYAT